MQTTQSSKAGERTQRFSARHLNGDGSYKLVGIFNPSIVEHEARYTQHICPHCLKANGENESGVIVECPECKTEYRVPAKPGKYAPGPWRVDAETPNHAPIITAEDGKGRDIAEIRGESKEERAATARLIATAPNMARFIWKLSGMTDIRRCLNSGLIREMQDLLTEAGLTK